MIKNDKVAVPEAVRKLMDSELAFFLGGSRRMNQLWPSFVEIKADTDYDFYTDDSPYVRNWLLKNGFVEKTSGEEYFDSECCAIFKHTTDDIQVITRIDAEFYQKVFESIDPKFYVDYLWKSAPNPGPRENIQGIFNQLFHTAHVMLEKK